jgi:hypothetical protein
MERPRVTIVFVRMWTRHVTIISCALVMSCGIASAQKPPDQAAPAQQQTAPPAPARSANCAPMAPNGTTTTDNSTVGRSNEPLGDKLARSDGVMCPPTGVDPEIRAPTPDTGKTPVIPPPGSPGGDPSIRPK